MRFKINYGGKTAYDPKDFSRGKFECIEYDFACVVFAEYQDALDFCAGRFFDPDGKPVKAVRA